MHRDSWLSYNNCEDKDIREQTQVSLYQSLSERLSEMTEFYHYLLLTPHTQWGKHCRRNIAEGVSREEQLRESGQL